jgi:stage V sporulation protein G
MDAMASPAPNLEADGSTSVAITVVAITPVRGDKLIALASVEVEVAGIVILLHGIQALRTDRPGTRVELPKYRDAAGVWRAAVSLPEEVRGPIGDAVLEALIERGLAVRVGNSK